MNSMICVCVSVRHNMVLRMKVICFHVFRGFFLLAMAATFWCFHETRDAGET